MRVLAMCRGALAPQGLSQGRGSVPGRGSEATALSQEARSQVSGSLCSPLRLPPAAPGPTLGSLVGGRLAGGVARGLPELTPGLLPQGAREGRQGAGGQQTWPLTFQTQPPTPPAGGEPGPPALLPCLVCSPHTSPPTALSSDQEAGRTGRGMKSQALSLRLWVVGPALPVPAEGVTRGAGGGQDGPRALAGLEMPSQAPAPESPSPGGCSVMPTERMMEVTVEEEGRALSEGPA